MLVKNEWTHEVHLAAAIYYLNNTDYFDAVCKIKSGIISLNNLHNTKNTGSTGYHETLTLFWTIIVSNFMKLNSQLPIEELINKFLESEWFDRDLPLKYYEKEDLKTSKFRAIYQSATKCKLKLE